MGAAPSGPLLGAGSRASAPASSRTLSARPASGGLGCPELGSAFRNSSSLPDVDVLQESVPWR